MGEGRERGRGGRGGGEGEKLMYSTCSVRKMTSDS